MINKPQKILIVDDSQTVLKYITSLLEPKYKVITAEDGQKGIKKAFVEQPDLILLDRRMPNMDGNETLVQLKTTGQTERIPVIMLTACNQASDIETSFELGAEDYIVKPFDDDRFLIRMEQVLKNNRA